VQRAEQHLRQLASDAPVIQTSARKSPSVSGWLDWLKEQVELQKTRVANQQTRLPRVQADGQHLHAHNESHHHHAHDHVHK
jgi:hydrogenase nickel incorporation protein HypB